MPQPPQSHHLPSWAAGNLLARSLQNNHTTDLEPPLPFAVIEQFIRGIRLLNEARMLEPSSYSTASYIAARNHPLLQRLRSEFITLWDSDDCPFFGLLDQLIELGKHPFPGTALERAKLAEAGRKDPALKDAIESEARQQEKALKELFIAIICALPGEPYALREHFFRPAVIPDFIPAGAGCNRSLLHLCSAMQDQDNPPVNTAHHLQYDFFPVGQGLFTSGFIHALHQPTPSILWVYDCGTSSSPELVDHGIEVLEHEARGRQRIDLLTLSHFDNDHISGVCQLIRRFKIGTLLLPYMPLAQRLIVAFEEHSGSPDDLERDFYLNPVAYLRAQGGPGIERILFVPPSRDAGPPFPPEGPGPQEPNSDDTPTLQFRQDQQGSPEEFDPLVRAGTEGQEKTDVDILGQGSAITAPTCRWEFVPYNDDPAAEIPADFVTEVEIHREHILQTSDPGLRDASLQRIKQAYDHQFGRNSEKRNEISLFLYSGPIYPRWTKRFIVVRRGSPPACLPIWHIIDPSDLIYCDGDYRCSALYTGDGYLDSPERLARLIGYLDAERIENTGIFQVMHHGAKLNWHSGVAAAIDPRFSVLCSDPERGRLKHPHAPVLRDFWRYGAVQVDKTFGLRVFGYLE